jgi:hypothetical protein
MLLCLLLDDEFTKLKVITDLRLYHVELNINVTQMCWFYYYDSYSMIENIGLCNKETHQTSII